MKILILCPYYFPNINPRAHRWTSIAEYWAAEGHDIHLVTSLHNSYPQKHILKEVNIHRTGFNSLKDILYYFSKSTPKRGEAQQSQKHAGQKGAFLQKVNDKVLRKIYFPDDAFTWYFPARRIAKQLICTHDFDLLISVSVPFTTHLVALSLKKQNSDLKWIADTGDPFAFQPLHPLNNYFLYGKWNRKLEQKVAENANFITLTNEGAKKLYQHKIPKQKQKYKVIPPLYQTKNHRNQVISIKNHTQSVIRLGYFGSFFKNIREPRPMLEFWVQFLEKQPEYKSRLELHFYGNIFENFLQDFIDLPSLQSHVFIHGLLSKEKAEQEMQRMDFLLNVGNATTFQLPSKSVDYLASGKPIINFCSEEEDTFYDFLKNKALIINVLNKEKGREKVRDFLKVYTEKRNIKEVDMLEFSATTIAKSYLNLV